MCETGGVRLALNFFSVACRVTINPQRKTAIYKEERHKHGGETGERGADENPDTPLRQKKNPKNAETPNSDIK